MLGKLQLMAAYFGEDIIYKIYVRSKVIHDMFDTNPELDINKLELFHLQFTASVIELLKKIKTSNERNVNLLYDEISLNKDMMERLNSTILTENNFNIDKQRQELKINRSLQQLFEVLSGNSTGNPISKNINAFSSRYSADFFYTIEPAVFNDLLVYDAKDVYNNEYAVIHKKLMGLLCRAEFKSSFFCGLKSGSQILEVYKLSEYDKYFLYSPSKSAFLFCDITKIGGIDWQNSKSKKENMICELKDKNDRLLSSAGVVKTNMPATVKALLTENYKKIEDINFLQNMSNFDVQANILKTMLNTDII